MRRRPERFHPLSLRGVGSPLRDNGVSGFPDQGRVLQGAACPGKPETDGRGRGGYAHSSFKNDSRPTSRKPSSQGPWVHVTEF